MSASKKEKRSKKKTVNKDEFVEVLYQKMGDRWYSFFVIEEEVYMGAIPDEAIDEIRHRNLKSHGPR